MAELVFHTGPMDCGKSTMALQLDYIQSSHGRKGRVFTSQDRAGEGVITSRLGLSATAIPRWPRDSTSGATSSAS